MERRARTGGSWQRLFSFRHYQGQGTFEKKFCEVLNFWGAIPHIENRGGYCQRGRGLFTRWPFIGSGCMSEKTKKGRIGKSTFADPARVHERKTATGCGFGKLETGAKAEKGLSIMAAMGVFLFLEERGP